MELSACTSSGTADTAASCSSGSCVPTSVAGVGSDSSRAEPLVMTALCFFRAHCSRESLQRFCDEVPGAESDSGPSATASITSDTVTRASSFRTGTSPPAKAFPTKDGVASETHAAWTRTRGSSSPSDGRSSRGNHLGMHGLSIQTGPESGLARILRWWAAPARELSHPPPVT